MPKYVAKRVLAPIDRARSIAAQLRRLQPHQRAVLEALWVDPVALADDLEAARLAGEAAVEAMVAAEGQLRGAQADNRTAAAEFVKWASAARRDLLWASASEHVRPEIGRALHAAAGLLDRRTRTHLGALRELGELCRSLAVIPVEMPVVAGRYAQAKAWLQRVEAGEAAARAADLAWMGTAADRRARKDEAEALVRVALDRWTAAQASAPGVLPDLVREEGDPRRSYLGRRTSKGRPRGHDEAAEREGPTAEGRGDLAEGADDHAVGADDVDDTSDEG